MKQRRFRLLASGLAATSVLAAGCSVGTSGSSSASGSAGGSITVAVVNNPDMITMEHLTPAFTKQTGIKVNYVTLNDQDLRQKVTAAAATKSGLYDVVMISPDEVQSGWAANKWILPLSSMIAKLPHSQQQAYDAGDLLPAVRDALSFKGQLYSVPFYGESNILYYRKDLFAKAHLTMPANPTWEQVAAFAKKLNNPAGGTYGVILKGLPVYGELAPLLTEINSFGARWFSPQWQPQLTSPQFEKAVQFYINLVRNYGEPGASGVGFQQGLNLMSQGKGAMWVDSTVAAGALDDPATSKVAGKIGYAQAPTQGCRNGSHWLYAWSLSIVKGTKNPDAALKFLLWATGKSYIQLVAQKDGWVNAPPGTRTSTYTNPRYTKVAPFAQVTLSAMNTATNNDPSCQPVPYKGTTAIYLPEFSNFGDQFAQGLASAVSGKESVSAWLKGSQSYTANVMTKAGYTK